MKNDQRGISRASKPSGDGCVVELKDKWHWLMEERANETMEALINFA
jgi:hypothetical protein